MAQARRIRKHNERAQLAKAPRPLASPRRPIAVSPLCRVAPSPLLLGLDELLQLFHRSLASPTHEHSLFFLEHYMPSVLRIRSRRQIGVSYRVRPNDDRVQEFAGRKM